MFVAIALYLYVFNELQTDYMGSDEHIWCVLLSLLHTDSLPFTNQSIKCNFCSKAGALSSYPESIE